MASLKLVGVTCAVPITCTYPLFNLLWAIFLIGEQVTWSTILGAAIIVSGIWLLSRREANAAEMQKKVLVKGVIFALATALIWSVSITMIDVAVTLPETNTLDHALAVNTIRIVSVASALLILSLIIDKKLSFFKTQRKSVAALISGGIIALGLG
ncbi:MAG: EamA family transporter [Candidatus Bathyarchaeota archaeon]|nr:EamA family transporter [Candidatus Bathyarchaeota archaeon A05DMB-5]MDH7557425.1 EamA family transporter [Candidatus Bathyarchaeota archaeon]